MSKVSEEQLTGRFKDAPWMKAPRPSILIGGVGGIGSNTVYCLTKSVPGVYFLVDHDRVDAHNVGTQFYSITDIGKSKVSCMSKAINSFTKDNMIYTLDQKIDLNCYAPITIAAFDNMQARTTLFDVWKKHDDRQLFVDGRLRASMYEVFSVIPGREDEYEKTLFSDEDVDEGPCTFKQTAYFGMLIGARITQVVVNHLTNLAIGEEVAQVPFFITEFGEPVVINVK